MSSQALPVASTLKKPLRKQNGNEYQVPENFTSPSSIALGKLSSKKAIHTEINVKSFRTRKN